MKFQYSVLETGFESKFVIISSKTWFPKKKSNFVFKAGF